MKRLNIHWSMRWGIRVIYGVVILAIALYLGLGLFIKSKLAGDLLVKQLSAQAGRPVKIGRVTLDWLHGFHVVLQDVVVPSLNGGPPPIACKSMVTTVEIWPFIARREIIFRHVRLEDGTLRLRRNAQGKWLGVFPVPVKPVRKTQKIVKPKKAKRRFVLFFPKVTLKRISVILILETGKEKKTYKMFLKDAETVGSAKTEKITGKANGTLYFYKSHHPVAFQARGSYALEAPFPFDADIQLSGFSLKQLPRFYAVPPRWELEGLSDISLHGWGKVKERFSFYGRVAIDNPRFVSPGCVVTSGQKCIFALEGKGSGTAKGMPAIAIEVKNPSQPVEVRLSRKGRPPYIQHGVFRNLSARASSSQSPKKLTATLKCDYHLGKEHETEKWGQIEMKGMWSPTGKTPFHLKVLATRIPLETLFRGARGNTPVLRASPAPAIGFPSLRYLDRFEGAIAGEKDQGRLMVRSHLAAMWGASKINVALAPFDFTGKGPLECRVTGARLDLSAVRSTPFIYNLLPPKVQGWTQAFQGGEIQSLSGRIKVQRPAGSKGWRAQVQSADMKLTDFSFSLPYEKTRVTEMSGKLSYHAPAAQVTEFHAIINDGLSVQIKRLSVSDIFHRPLPLSVEGEIASRGIPLPAGGGDPGNPSLRIPLPKSGAFVPRYFSGAARVKFTGTLFPFSAQDYQVTLNDILLKGWLSRKDLSLELPVDMTAHGTVTPKAIQMVHASLSSPLGMIIAEGAARHTDSGKWQIDARANGRVSFDNPQAYTLASFSRHFRVTGKASFSLKAQGTWPQVALQGGMDAKKLFFSYKDIFIKDAGIPASIDFQLRQTGPQSCEIDWIRANLRGFIVRIWGALSSLNPVRGKINCVTDSHQLQYFMPLFPRFCQGKQCLLAKGDIQCTGQVVLKEKPIYHIKAVLANVSVPFPGGTEPVTIAKASFLLSERKRSVNIEDVLYRESYASQVNLTGNLREGQWFWDAKLVLGYLNLDDFLAKLHLHHKGPKAPRPPFKEKDTRDFIARALEFLHGKYFEGSISVKELKIFKYHLMEFFTRFHQRGNEGAIRGLNFLTEQKGFGAIDVNWHETLNGKGVDLMLSPIVSNLDFGKILDGILGRSSPFRGWLTFDGTLTSQGGSYRTLRDGLNGGLDVTFKKGVITHWAVLTSIFQLLDIYDIITLKSLPGISKEGLQYDMIHGTIQVKKGVARTRDAYLKSQPFFMTGEGTLWLNNHHVSLLIGVYPFKMLDSFVSHIPILGRILTNKDKKFIGYFFKAEGNVANPKVTSINAQKLGKRIWSTFKKIITLPLYPFQDHSKQDNFAKSHNDAAK